VLLDISALKPDIDSRPVVTKTLPPLPVLPGSATLPMPVMKMAQ